VPDNPFTLTVRATVTVTDLAALVRQVDELVALSDDFEPIDDGTYWDGWEEREGSGYLFQGDAVWLDDDPRSMLDLAVSLSRLRAQGVDIDLDADVDPRPPRAGSDEPRFAVVVRVYDASVSQSQVASAWLGSLKGTSPLLLCTRSTVALLESTAGCDVKVTSAVARTVEGPLTSPFERVVVTNGGEHYETDETGRLLRPIPEEPADPTGRRPLRFDGRTAAGFVRFAHPIPISRGFRRAWVALNAPGWTGNELFRALSRAGLVDRSGPVPRLVDGVTRVDIEPDGTCSRIDLHPRRLRPR
jgi:hypothetical protein